MRPGDTVFGIDPGNHLWMVLTSPAAAGEVAVANLTTHDPERRRLCGDHCVVVRPEEHPYPQRDSCVFYRDAFLTSAEQLRRGESRNLYRVGEPLEPGLLARIRQGALASRLTSEAVKAAIRQDQG